MDKNKKIAKELNKKYKGFKFEFDGQILTLEVKLPFRIMVTDTSGLNHCDDKEYQKIQNELRRDLFKIDNSNTITVVECGYIQYFTRNVETIDIVSEHIKTFIKDKTEQYGKYFKMGRECNKVLLDDLGISETAPKAKIEPKRKRVVKPVLQYDLDGEFIKEWDNAYEAAEAVSGVRGAVGNIYQCCLGHYKTAYGFVWKYKL